MNFYAADTFMCMGIFSLVSNTDSVLLHSLALHNLSPVQTRVFDNEEFLLLRFNQSGNSHLGAHTGKPEKFVGDLDSIISSNAARLL